jgi:hypothetical protein
VKKQTKKIRISPKFMAKAKNAFYCIAISLLIHFGLLCCRYGLYEIPDNLDLWKDKKYFLNLIIVYIKEYFSFGFYIKFTFIYLCVLYLMNFFSNKSIQKISNKSKTKKLIDEDKKNA